MEINFNSKLEENIHCTLCRSKKIKEKVFFKDAPVFLGCSNEPQEKDSFISFHILICHNCGLIQSNAKLPYDVYSTTHSEALGGIWKKHFDAFSCFASNQIEKHIGPECSIIEIGPSTTPFSRSLTVNFSSIDYIDMMPSLSFSLFENEKFLSGLYPQQKPSKKVDVLLGSHVFEHISDVSLFLDEAINNLNQNGLIIISIPDFKNWLKNNYWNAITAEHIIYPFQDQLVFISHSRGLDVEFEIFGDHSLFACFRKANTSTISQSLQNQKILLEIQKSENLLDNWAEQILNTCKQILQRLPTSNNNLYLTGASHLSQYFVLLTSFKGRISGVLDNSKLKVGKRLYGTSLFAFSFDEIRGKEKPIVVVFPSPYSFEICTQVRSLNKEATIICS